MLRDDMQLYTKLTGEDGTHVPIIKLGAYLDGYEKGLSVLEDIENEIEQLACDEYNTLIAQGLCKALEVIAKYKGENTDERNISNRLRANDRKD